MRLLPRRESMAVEVSESRAAQEEILPPVIVPGAHPATKSKWYSWRQDGRALIAYLLDAEVHTFAFSVAANAIISFIPFIVLLYTLALSVFHSPAMRDVVDQVVNYYLPSAAKEKGWLVGTI